MSKFIIKKSPPLKGTISISGSKNSVLPILAACLLTDEKCTISCAPPLSDVFHMLEILKSMGVFSSFDIQNEEIEIQAKTVFRPEEDYALANSMRASFLAAGPLLARTGRFSIPLPGGCQIGSRPVDLHLKGFQQLGATIVQEHGAIQASCKKLVGCRIYLDFPSVGATENILMAASLAEGQTTIENAAAEPEIVDLANFINEMGGKINGAGTDTLYITGVKKLYGTHHKVIPDRIEAGTFMAAAALTGGDIYLKNVDPDHIKPIRAKLSEANTMTEDIKNGIHVYQKGPILPINLKTLPYPGIPTDIQAPLMSLMAVADGTSVITETIFENRFLHASELNRMGAHIRVESRSAIIEGVPKLTGTQVKATDLRAGAALILSALKAEGQTEISDIYHIERGYSRIEEKLKRLGALIKRVNDDNQFNL
ncbi:MAG: UDP-N-acetylglucosamine 1-carboxyvinyltransferase [Clostridiales bacterium]|nr:UDP-N-acetylglucosamine 1-carboxyvinyltransferase [Clostridiales bacterium]